MYTCIKLILADHRHRERYLVCQRDRKAVEAGEDVLQGHRTGWHLAAPVVDKVVAVPPAVLVRVAVMPPPRQRALLAVNRAAVVSCL